MTVDDIGEEQDHGTVVHEVADQDVESALDHSSTETTPRPLILIRAGPYISVYGRFGIRTAVLKIPQSSEPNECQVNHVPCKKIITAHWGMQAINEGTYTQLRVSCQRRPKHDKWISWQIQRLTVGANTSGATTFPRHASCRPSLRGTRNVWAYIGE